MGFFGDLLGGIGDAATGAVTGLMVGGPIGALVGGVAGLAGGAYDNYTQTQTQNNALAMGQSAANTAISGLNTAYQSALDMSQQGTDQAIAAMQEQLGTSQGLLDPYAQAGGQALQQQQALSGALGPEAQQQAIQGIENSPQLQAMMQQGENALLQNASATGGLRGGNTQGALAQFRPQMLNQAINQQYTQLGGLSGMGQNAATNLANFGNQYGQNVGNLLSGQANNNASLLYNNASNVANIQTGQASDAINMQLMQAQQNPGVMDTMMNVAGMYTAMGMPGLPKSKG